MQDTEQLLCQISICYVWIIYFIIFLSSYEIICIWSRSSHNLCNTPINNESPWNVKYLNKVSLDWIETGFNKNDFTESR